MKQWLIVSGLFVCSIAPARGQGPAPPISGIQTQDFGFGSGWIQPMTAGYGWDAVNSALHVKTGAFSCCNTYYQGFYLLYGQNPIPTSALFLPSPPFWDSSLLFIIPDAALGFFPGLEVSIPVPPDPLLVGQTFQLQVIGQWFTTIGFTTEYGVSQATLLTFI